MTIQGIICISACQWYTRTQEVKRSNIHICVIDALGTSIAFDCTGMPACTHWNDLCMRKTKTLNAAWFMWNAISFCFYFILYYTFMHIRTCRNTSERVRTSAWMNKNRLIIEMLYTLTFYSMVETFKSVFGVKVLQFLIQEASYTSQLI